MPEVGKIVYDETTDTRMMNIFDPFGWKEDLEPLPKRRSAGNRKKPMNRKAQRQARKVTRRNRKQK